MKNKLTICLIIMLITIGTFQYSLADSSNYTDSSFYCKDIDKGVLAYKQISAFRLSLADGSVLADAVATTDSSVDIEENMKNVEIILILDASGSMSGTRNETTKKATKELTDALFNQIGKEHLKMGAIFFSNDMAGILNLTDDKERIKQHLNTLPADGGTYMSSALNKAKEMLSESPGGEDTIKIVCTLSDGALMDEAEAMAAFRAINAAGISTMSIFVETSITSAFSQLETENGEYHKNFQTSTANLAETIATDIYNEIYLKIILMADPITVYNISNAGIITGDKAIIQVDEEIIHGATLEVEYVFNIITAFDCTDIKITDFKSNSFIFNPNQRLLTENKTNNDYGWKYKEGSLISESGSRTINGTEEYQIKLILSTMITPQRLNDLGKLENYAEFQLKNISKDEVITLDKNTTDPENPKIKALDILIIPPTGKYFLYLLEKNALASTLFVGFMSLILIIVCVEDYAQSERKKAIKR